MPLSRASRAADILAGVARTEFARIGNQAMQDILATKKKTHAARHPEVGYLEHRKTVFLGLVGDKPVDAYTRSDLQEFAEELAWLPPNVSKKADYDPIKVKHFIAATKEIEGPGLARKTIREFYLSRVKTMLREACGDAKVPIGFEGRIVIPKRAQPSKKSKAPDHGEIGKVVAATFCRLKDFRRIATRYDKLARNYNLAVALAAVIPFWC